MKITKICAFLAIAAAGLLTMTGCGERSAERKIKKAALRYIADKYGIKAEVTEVELRHVGELEGVWHKKDGGYASMTYQGRTFRAYVDVKNGDYAVDNYRQADYDEQLTQYFSEQLRCDDIFVMTTYGGTIRCGVPMEIKTFEDLTAKCENIEITVSVTGLDKDSVQNVDASLFGEKTRIRLMDWSDASCMRDQEMLIHSASDSFANGKLRFYCEFEGGKIQSSLP